MTAPMAISLKEKYSFSIQLASAVDGGIPIINALSSIIEQCPNRKLLEVLKGVQRDLKTGESFSASLSKYPDAFPKFYIDMFESGEVSGDMAQALYKLAAQLERDIKIRRDVISVIIYPALIGLTAFGIIAYLFFFA